jgi:hypothetical protein
VKRGEEEEEDVGLYNIQHARHDTTFYVRS